MNNIIGILGGMGPAATADTLNKFVDLREANHDQQHIPILVSCIPDIPDRSAYLLSGGPSPYGRLKDYLRMLEAAGARCIIIPCNTAHYWFDSLKKISKAKMISILDTTVSEILPSAKSVGLIATSATLATRLYQKKIEARALNLILPEESSQREIVRAIYAFKGGNKVVAEKVMLPQIDRLVSCGAQSIILGCTEIPLIVAGREKNIKCQLVDSTASLVRAAIRWYESVE